MCAYPRVNGAYACENAYLLQEVLREDWGFKGFVLADYGAAKTTAPSLNNGLDFDPWPGHLVQPDERDRGALASGQADFERVNEHVRAILRTLFAYGFFDREAYVYDDAQIDKEANLRAAQRIEESAITLLRNRRKTLPLKAKKLKSIALIGRNADEFTTGGGSANVRPFMFQSPREAIEARAGEGVDVRFDDGSDPERAADLARALGRRDRLRRRLPDGVHRPPLPQPAVPALERRPGRADRDGRRRPTSARSSCSRPAARC